MREGRNRHLASFIAGPVQLREEQMNKPLVLAAAILGVIFLVIACVYWFVPAGSLPHFMPGFVDGSNHVHVKHGLVALVLALALLGFAWVKREG
jgi:ammonia channel protein AmtB